MNNYREMYEALLRGDTLECRGCILYMDNDGNINIDENQIVNMNCLIPSLWSIKPKTININGFEVPEPVREPPKEGENFWLSDMYGESGVIELRWRNDSENHNLWLSKGMIHRSKEGAAIHTKALWSFTAKEGV